MCSCSLALQRSPCSRLRNPATYKDWSRTWEQTTSGKEESRPSDLLRKNATFLLHVTYGLCFICLLCQVSLDFLLLCTVFHQFCGSNISLLQYLLSTRLIPWKRNALIWGHERKCWSCLDNSAVELIDRPALLLLSLQEPLSVIQCYSYDFICRLGAAPICLGSVIKLHLLTGTNSSCSRT